MSDIDTNKLRRLDGGLLLVFRELLRTGRASRVAESLGLSQPAISHALARLRDLFADPLFVRRPHGFEPTLRASTKTLGDSVEIRIRDNGTGIPPEVREKMFDPFFTTKPAGEGTGLGLSMSHDIIVKQHGGTIEVDTEQGHFTEFRIVLPRTTNFAEKPRG